MTDQAELIPIIVALGRDWRNNDALRYTVDADQQTRCGDVLLTMLDDGSGEVIRKCVELAYHWRYSHRVPITPATEQQVHCAGALLILLKDNGVDLPPCVSVKHPLTIHPRLGTGGRVLTIPGTHKARAWMTH